MNMIERLSKNMEQSTFCVAKEGGQGFVHKSECVCTIDNPCQPILDKKRFQESFKDVKHGDMERRKEILQQIKPEFMNSQWWRDNILE